MIKLTKNIAIIVMFAIIIAILIPTASVSAAMVEPQCKEQRDPSDLFFEPVGVYYEGSSTWRVIVSDEATEVAVNLANLINDINSFVITASVNGGADVGPFVAYNVAQAAGVPAIYVYPDTATWGMNGAAYIVVGMTGVTATTSKTVVFNVDGILYTVVFERVSPEPEKIFVLDEETGIMVAAAGVSAINVDTSLIVEPILEGTVFDGIKLLLKDAKDFVAFDIRLSNQIEELDGIAEVYIPLPGGFDENNLKAYRVVEGEIVAEYGVEVVTIDGVKYAVFLTDHFSDYILADMGTRPPVIAPTPTEKTDNEPKMGETTYVLSASIIAIISLGIYAVVKFKK